VEVDSAQTVGESDEVVVVTVHFGPEKAALYVLFNLWRSQIASVVGRIMSTEDIAITEGLVCRMQNEFLYPPVQELRHE
jgi:hypothetical protein